MEKYLRAGWLITAFSLFLLAGCGHQQSPSGGPQDKVAPVLDLVLPVPGPVPTDGVYELTFNKDLDEDYTGIALYPPLDHTVEVSNRTITVKVTEPVPAGNLYLTVTPGLTDTHDNKFVGWQTLVYYQGQPEEGTVSGTLSFEKKEDATLPVYLGLFSADSLLIQRETATGSAFAIKNTCSHTAFIQAYADKNSDGRWNQESEPGCWQPVTNGRTSTVALNLQYKDETPPQFSKAEFLDNRHLLVTFNEDIATVEQPDLINESAKIPVTIEGLSQEGSKLTLLLAPVDTTSYRLTCKKVIDKKGNTLYDIDQNIEGVALADTTLPRIISVEPKQNSVIHTLTPRFTVLFSEIIPWQNAKFALYYAENNKEIDMQALQSNSNRYVLTPKKPLANFSNYRFCIKKQTADAAENSLKEDMELQFITVVNN